MAVSDRIIVMNNAEIAQEGTPADLYESPSSAFIADFIGDANLATCQIKDISGDIATVSLDNNRFQIPNSGLTKGDAQIVLRPYQLTLAKADAPSIKGQISYAAYLGKEVQYTVESPLGSLFVISNVLDNPFAKGDTVSVQFNENHARLVAA